MAGLPQAMQFMEEVARVTAYGRRRKPEFEEYLDADRRDLRVLILVYLLEIKDNAPS